MTIDMSSWVQRGQGQAYTEIDGEVVMMTIDSGKYYGLAGIGSRIWVLIEQPMEVSKLCGLLLDEFEVDRETCEADLLVFLNEMETQGLLEVRPGI